MRTRFLKISIIGLLATIIIYSCGLSSGTVSNLNNTICSNYTDMSTLEVRLIKTMTNRYKTRQLKAINTSTSITGFTESIPRDPNSEDTRAIWFDLETLKAFIHQIEVKAKNNVDPVKSEDLGIRIYYASYPESSETFNDLNGANGNFVLPANYQDHHTVIMIPTMYRNGEIVDFNPLEPATYNKPISSVYSTNPSAQIPALTGIRSSSSNNRGAQNHGGSYPPLGDSGLDF